MKPHLPKFEGREVDASSLKISGSTEDHVGALHQEEVVYTVTKAVVSGVDHRFVKDIYTRAHKATPVAMVVVDEATGEKMLEQAYEAAEARFGVKGLFAGQGAQDAPQSRRGRKE